MTAELLAPDPAQAPDVYLTWLGARSAEQKTPNALRKFWQIEKVRRKFLSATHIAAAQSIFDAAMMKFWGDS